MYYLTVAEVEVMHGLVIKDFGGSHGVRSPELLKSAVFKMQATFDGQDLYQNIFEKAAALLESLCKNHPFVDGNKRTAFTAAVTFLEVNKWVGKFKKEEAEYLMVSIASGGVKFGEIAKFLEKNSKKKKSSKL